MAAAARGNKSSSFLMLLLLLLSSLVLVVPALDEDGHGGGGGSKGFGTEKKKVEKETEPEVVERAIGVTGFMNRWDAFRTWAKLAWMKFKPPDSRSKSSPGQVVKEAASRSFESSKEAVEHAAKSAAKVAEEAVYKTKEKVKRTVSNDAGANPDAEL